VRHNNKHIAPSTHRYRIVRAHPCDRVAIGVPYVRVPKKTDFFQIRCLY
jgi:hypothetical protein